MKIVTVVGARPQFIKAAAVSRVIANTEGLDECLVHTGQHYDDEMSNIFFSELGLSKPAYNLGIGGGHHGKMTGRQLEAIEQVLLDEKPDQLLVFGDTNSTLAGALAAVKLCIPVIHVEAGLRSFNRVMPEELNRVLTDHAATLLLAPTTTAMTNLAREGLAEKAFLVGDVMYDAALFYGQIAEQQSSILLELSLKVGHYVLATIHRAENTDDELRLNNIVTGLSELGKTQKVILPVHPRTLAKLKSAGLYDQLKQTVQLIAPLGYLDMVMLEKGASLVVTDSGGVQKEAFFHGIPCVTLREETEWVELLDLGWNRLVPQEALSNLSVICQQAKKSVGLGGQPYGDGTAAYKIVEQISSL